LVIIFKYNIWAGDIGKTEISWSLKNKLRTRITTSETLPESICSVNLPIFVKVLPPEAIAETILTKLSSVKVIEETYLVTSLPPLPIAIPISAILMAGCIIDTITSHCYKLFHDGDEGYQ